MTAYRLTKSPRQRPWWRAAETGRWLTQLGTIAGGLVASCVLLAASLWAQTSTVDLKNPELIAKGSSQFAKSCAVGYCHGAEGRPARGPDLRARAWTPQQLFQIVHDGIPDTTMPGWKNILPGSEIWAVVAYVLSISGADMDSSTVEVASSAAPARELSPQEQTGRDLFFDLNNQRRCAVCHKLGRLGSEVGPNLVLSAVQKSADELMKDIVEPDASIAPGFEATVVVTKQGERVTGVKQEQNEEVTRIFDTASFPPPLRSFYKDEIRSVSTRQGSLMPSNYRGVYSEEDLKAILAFLKSGVF